MKTTLSWLSLSMASILFFFGSGFQAQTTGLSPWVWVLIIVVLILVLGWWMARTSRTSTPPEIKPHSEVHTTPEVAPYSAPHSEPHSAPHPAVQTFDVPATQPEAITDEAAPVTSDDLVIIEGIGPKIAQTLNAAGITTFSQLASTDIASLEEILRSHGLQMIDPHSWPEQARLAAAGDQAGLQALQDRLKGGR